MMNNEHEDPPVDGGYTGLSRNAPPSAERWPHRAPTDETEVLRQRLLDYGDANVKMQARVTELEAERDKAMADYRFMVERAADQKLDGYREPCANGPDCRVCKGKRILRQSAAELGLHLVTDAEKRVLDAMAGIPLAALRRWIARRFTTVLGLAHAELARRGEEA